MRFRPLLLVLAFPLFADDSATPADAPADPSAPAAVVFEDQFHGKLGDGWIWLRERKESWRISAQGLEVLVEPGNMWGPQNDARNVLLHPVPEPVTGTIEISVTVQNAPTHQFEQADLVWYYDDSNMVKVGEELVDGKLCVVMGREEKDKTRTISITPLESTTVRLRMLVKGGQIHGYFKTPGANDWKEVGSCDLPKVEKSKEPAKISLQFYQGAPGVQHWARATDFQISRR